MKSYKNCTENQKNTRALIAALSVVMMIAIFSIAINRNTSTPSQAEAQVTTQEAGTSSLSAQVLATK